jgi:hypothetical protein
MPDLLYLKGGRGRAGRAHSPYVPGPAARFFGAGRPSVSVPRSACKSLHWWRGYCAITSPRCPAAADVWTVGNRHGRAVEALQLASQWPLDATVGRCASSRSCAMIQAGTPGSMSRYDHTLADRYPQICGSHPPRPRQFNAQHSPGLEVFSCNVSHTTRSNVSNPLVNWRRP